MDRTERFYRIDQLLNERKVVPFSVLEEKLEVSRATVKRDLEYMRNRLNAPIVWDREAGGYKFAGREGGAAQYELPGLWFSAQEVHALLTMQHLLMNLDTGGLLGPHIAPLLARLRALLGTADDTTEEIHKRIRILGMASRRLALDHFAVVGSANCGMRSYSNDTEVAAGICDEPTNDRCSYHFAHQLRIAVWAEHLNLDTPAGRAELDDGVASASLWLRPPPGARITPYETRSGVYSPTPDALIEPQGGGEIVEPP